MALRRLDLTQARQIAVRAQLLDAPPPDDLVEVIGRLTFLQIDPTSAIAPSADLVLWSRLGAAYKPSELTRALEVERTLLEHNVVIRPMSDLRLLLADMQVWPTHDYYREWLDANKDFRHDILDLLDERGPLLTGEIPDTSAVPWQSTGWTNDRNVVQMLECLMMSGDVATSAREGRQRIWDLAERVYHADVVAVPREEAAVIRNERLLRSLGIARPRTVGGVGERVEVDGTQGAWTVDPEELADVERPFEGRTVLLSPLDRLVHDRKRLAEIFGFEYFLEMYKPKDQRRWGYWALPILHRDRLIGKLDAKADRKQSVLHVYAVHPDVRFTRAVSEAVDDEIEALASWLGLVEIDRGG